MTDEITDSDKDSSQKLFYEDDSTNRFIRAFEASVRRWELVIYPVMLAFGVLAASGFYLVYSLSKDIHTLAISMDPELGKNLSHMSESVNYLSENMGTMTRRIYHMSISMETMADRMGAMKYMEPMLINMYGINQSADSMNQSIYSITGTMDGLRYELDSVSDSMRPMGNMNDLMP